MSMPKVSVITVCYNCSKDLQDTLDSVKQQRYQNLECVVIDGASTDNTPTVIDAFQDTINISISEPDRGIYDAMNKGIQLATGDWLIFMNAGDTFAANDVIEQVMSQLEPTTDFIFGDRYKCETDGSVQYESAGPIEHTRHQEVVFHQALFTKAALLKETPYNQHYTLAADYEYVVRAFSEGRVFQHVPVAVCNFVCGGRSRQQNIRAMIEALKVIIDNEPDVNKWRDSAVFRHFIQNHMEFVVGKNLQEYIAETKARSLELKHQENGGYQLISSPSYPPIERFFAKVFRPLSHPSVGFQLPEKQSSGLSTPKISVITVVYNDAPGLARTIKSTMQQDYQNIEYIVVDGASTDETQKVLASNRALFDQCVSEPDTGIYDAMNKGIRLASGDYAIFMNAGDTFASPKSVSSTIAQLDENIDVIYGDRNYVAVDGTITHQPAKTMDTVFKRMPYCHQAVFVKLSVLRKHPFNETYRFAADYNQVVEMYNAGYNFQKIDFTVCNFAEGGKSESGVKPYLEVMKIQLDNAPKGYKPSESEYIRAFKNNVESLLGD